MSRSLVNTDIVDTDMFLDMPSTARLLYYDLLIRADNDGFITPQRVIRMTGASQDDLKIIIAKKFAYMWDDGVVILLHYREHNHVRDDRYKPSEYYPRIKQLGKLYSLGARRLVDKMDTKWIPNGAKKLPQDKISKDKISNNNTPISPLKGDNQKGLIPIKYEESEVSLYWEQVINPITVDRDKELAACLEMMSQYGVDLCRKVIDSVVLAHTDTWAHKMVQVSSPRSMKKSFDRILIYRKSLQAKTQKTATIHSYN